MTTLNYEVPFGVTTEDPFGIEDGFDNFEMISLSGDESKTAAIADDKAGEYVPASAVSVDGKVSLSATYRRNSLATVDLTDAELVVGAAAPEAIDSFTLTCNKGAFPEISISGHKHVGGARVNHNDTERTLTAANGGLPSSFPAFGATDFGLQLGVPVEAIQSASWAVGINHTDDTGADGNWLCGTSHGIKITASFSAIDPTDWTIPSGWIVASKSNVATQSNTAHQSRSLTIEKYLAGPSESSED